MKRIISLVLRKIPRKYLQRGAAPFLWLFALFYTGRTVICPICDRHLRRFLPYGRRPRSNALCPRCLALERHRLVWLYLRRKTAFFNRRLQVLHIAPEACFIRRFERVHGQGYITADLESPLAKVKMDIHAMPFEANRFDMVICNHVLEHVDDDLKALGEIRRVMKPGGLAILQVPFFHPVPEVTIEAPTITSPADREKMFGQRDHVRKYGKDYMQRIARSGLRPFHDDFADTLDAAEIARFGIAKGETIYGALK